MNDSFTPEERALVERLNNAPQPELDPSAFEVIRGRMLDAMDTPYPGTDIAPRTFPVSTPVVIAAVAIVVVIVTVIAIAISNRPPEQPIAAPSETAPPTVTVEPTQTLTTPTAAETSTPQVTASITLSPTSDVAAIETLEPIMLIEGPVQNINVNIITIYNIDITLAPDDPLLSVIQIGDVIRVDAHYDTNSTVVVAIDVEYVTVEANDDIAVNPGTGESWQDNGNCDNPPPPWAPAHGWRRRCEGGNAPGNSGNNGNGNGDSDDEAAGNGMGMGD